MGKVDLKIDWATYEAAKYAVEHWHYSKCLPKCKLVKIGVWEAGDFIGVVIFSYGASNNLVKPYGLKMIQGCELTRIALKAHQTPVSKIISIALKMLRKSNPGLRIVVSFADTGQGHHGGIYQATNWIYTGDTSEADRFYLINGKKIHPRAVSLRYKTRSIPELQRRGIDVSLFQAEPKHRYLMPLDDEMRKRIEPLRKPYPKRDKQAIGSYQEHSGGAAPTVTLQNKRPKQAMTGDQPEQRECSAHPDAPIQEE